AANDREDLPRSRVRHRLVPDDDDAARRVRRIAGAEWSELSCRLRVVHQDSELASRRFRRYRLARLDLAEDVLGDELYDAIRRTFDALEDEVARDHLLEL